MVTQQSDLTVYVIDAAAPRRDELALLLGREGIRFQLFADAELFMAGAGAETAGCVIAEWAPGQDGEVGGVEFLRRLRGKNISVPVVFAAGEASGREVRLAFRGGAADVLFQPVRPEDVLGSIEEAFAAERKRIATRRRAKQRDSLLETLTRREREVASLAAQGHDNQLIGRRLGISHRTVEVHKSRLMRKLGARSLADLIRLGAQIQK